MEETSVMRVPSDDSSGYSSDHSSQMSSRVMITTMHNPPHVNHLSSTTHHPQSKDLQQNQRRPQHHHRGGHGQMTKQYSHDSYPYDVIWEDERIHTVGNNIMGHHEHSKQVLSNMESHHVQERPRYTQEEPIYQNGFHHQGRAGAAQDITKGYKIMDKHRTSRHADNHQTKARADNHWMPHQYLNVDVPLKITASRTITNKPPNVSNGEQPKRELNKALSYGILEDVMGGRCHNCEEHRRRSAESAFQETPRRDYQSQVNYRDSKENHHQQPNMSVSPARQGSMPASTNHANVNSRRQLWSNDRSQSMDSGTLSKPYVLPDQSSQGHGHKSNANGHHTSVSPPSAIYVNCKDLRPRSAGAERAVPQKTLPKEEHRLPNGHAAPSHTSPTHHHTSSSTASSPTTPSSDAHKKSLKAHLHAISENLGALFKSSTLKRTATKSDGEFRARLGRSNSTPDCLEDLDNVLVGRDPDSDSDEDDYGFQTMSRKDKRRVKLSSSYPLSSASSTAMQKAKSPSQAHRILPKRWRRSKLGSAGKTAASLWKHEGACTWSSMSGRKVVLPTTELHKLTELERMAFQKIALAKLQAMQLNCTITVPKDPAQKRSKKPGFSLKRRTGQGGFLDFKDKVKDRDAKDGGHGWVFGIPLAKCIANDVVLRRRKPSTCCGRRESLDLSTSNRRGRKSSSSSGGAISCDSLSESDHSRGGGGSGLVHHHPGGPGDGSRSGGGGGGGSNLLDALSLSSSSRLECARREQEQALITHSPQVPYVLTNCFNYLQNHGLRVLGIFRIGSSKKRIKQLREDFDSGKNVQIGDEHNPHDVGGLLKEFFRDLPDPLLTRDLYSSFVATRKLRSEQEQVEALRSLVALLPAAHRDTLWALLNFLNLVAKHSTDSIDQYGHTLPGNRMDVHNLATLFGPNLLHKSRGGEFQVESLERAEERQDVIATTQLLICASKQIFQVPAPQYDDVMRMLHCTHPEALDLILKQKSNALMIEIDPETSSSVCEESDSSSIPHSPSCGSEPDMSAGCPRNLHDALALQPTSPHKHTAPQPRLRSADPPAVNDGGAPRAGAPYRLTAPEAQWYRPERSKSPASPRISPSPKTSRTSPNLHIRVISDSPPDRTRHVGPARPQSSGNMLTVPQSHSCRASANRESTSSLSSGYCAGSSRSGTNSPTTPDVTSHSTAKEKWYLDSPPRSPRMGGHFPPLSPQDVGQQGGRTGGDRLSEECAPGFQGGTSSTQRPLGVHLLHTESSPEIHDCHSTAEWQKDHWKHWERLAQEHSDEFHEQETLV